MLERTGRKNQIRALSLLLCLIMALPCLLQPGCSLAETETTWREEIPELLSAAPYTEGSVIAGFSGVSEDELAGLFPDDRIDAAPLYEIEEGTELLAEITSSELTTEELLRKLAENPAVLYAEPNYLSVTQDLQTDESNDDSEKKQQPVTPYDQLSNMTPWQWGLSDKGVMRDPALKGQTPTSSAHVLPDLSGTGSNMDRTVYCAVIDEFADYNNPDLTPVMCHFTAAEQAALGCGEWGYNASNFNGGGQTTADFMPGDHGTHCAGLLGAAWDGKGISGAASNVKILSIQTSDPIEVDRSNPFGGMTMEVSAILRAYSFIDRYNSYYARTAPEKIIRIISMSLGFPSTSRFLNAAMYKLGQKYNTLTFVAAGNDSTNDDVMLDEHCTMRENPYVLVISATDQSGDLSCYSDYGQYTATLAAPGSNMLSTQPMETANYFPGFVREGAYKDIYYEDFSNYDGTGLKIMQVDYNGTTETNEAYTMTSTSWSGGKGLAIKINHAFQSPDEDSETLLMTRFKVRIPLTAEQAIRIQDSGNEAQFGMIYSGNSVMSTDDILVRLWDSGEEDTCLEVHRKETHSTGSWNVCSSGPASTTSANLYCVIPESVLDDIVLDFDIYIRVAENTDTLIFDSFGIGTNGVPYSIFDGTSMATPTAAGIGAVYVSRHPDEDGIQLAARIRASVTKTVALQGKLETGGRIDLANDVAGTWQYPANVKASWPLYETTLPLDKSTGDPFRLDAPGDEETYGLFEEGGGKLWYIPAYLGQQGDRTDAYIYPEMRCFDPDTGCWDKSRTMKIPGGPLWNVSTCVWNGEIWVYGILGQRHADSTFYTGSCEAAVPKVYSFQPETMVWKEHSVRNITKPAAYVLFADQNGLMIYDNDTSGFTETERPERGGADQNKMIIYAYDPEEGKGDEVARYNEFLRDPQIVTHGDTTWIFSIESHDDKVEAFRMQNGKISKLQLTMPSILYETNPTYSATKELRDQVPASSVAYKSIVAGEEGLYFVGYMDEDRKADTWIMPYGGSKMIPYGKHLSVMRPFGVSAVIRDGILYAIAADWGETNSRVFRATRVEGEEPTPVPTATPAPTNTPKPVPKTGDKAEPALYLVLVIIGLIGIIGSGWMIVMKQKKEQ